MGDKPRYALLPEAVLWSPVLSAGAVRLYATLSRFTDRAGVAWPSRRLLADKLGVSRDTVDRFARELVDAGFVTVEHQFDQAGDMTSNRWVLVAGHGPGGDRTGAATVAAKVRGGGRKDTATGGRKDAATGGRTVAAQKNNQVEREPKGTSSTTLVTVDTDPARLANLLADLIEGNGSRRPTVTEAWVRTVDRMIRLDGRTPQQVENAIRWCQQDDFWHRNILSPEKLRKHYEQMRLQAAQRKRQPTAMTAAQEFLARLGHDAS